MKPELSEALWLTGSTYFIPLPGFIVLASGGNNPSGDKKLWGSGFYPPFTRGYSAARRATPPSTSVTPDGMPRDLRGQSIAAINELNKRQYAAAGDPETLTRIK